MNNDTAKQIDDVLSKLYDYEHINIEKFYNDKYNRELLEVLDDALKRGYVKREEMENIEDLKESLDSFLKFESNHNFKFGDFL